jgi:hypothetical protein
MWVIETVFELTDLKIMCTVCYLENKGYCIWQKAITGDTACSGFKITVI